MKTVETVERYQTSYTYFCGDLCVVKELAGRPLRSELPVLLTGRDVYALLHGQRGPRSVRLLSVGRPGGVSSEL